MKFYRYVITEDAVTDINGEFVPPSFPNPKVKLKTFDLIKETPKGYWIGNKSLYREDDSIRIQCRWVSKTAKKRFAYPEQEKAKTSFIKRNERRIQILQSQIVRCRIALSIINELN